MGWWHNSPLITAKITTLDMLQSKMPIARVSPKGGSSPPHCCSNLLTLSALEWLKRSREIQPNDQQGSHVAKNVFHSPSYFILTRKMSTKRFPSTQSKFLILSSLLFWRFLYIIIQFLWSMQTRLQSHTLISPCDIYFFKRCKTGSKHQALQISN